MRSGPVHVATVIAAGCPDCGWSELCETSGHAHQAATLHYQGCSEAKKRLQDRARESR